MSLDDHIAELSRRLAAADKESKQLRQEVGALEMARHAQEMFRNTEHDDRVSAEARKKHSDPTVSLGPLGQRRTRPPNLHVHPPGEQEFYDELHAKISEATQLMNVFRHAQDDLTTKEATLRKMESNVASQEAHFKWMQERSKWRSSSGPRSCPIHEQNAQLEMQKRLGDLSKVQQVLEEDIAHQTAKLGELRDRLDQTPAFEEELRQLKTEVAVLGLEESSVQDEINANRRLLKRKDRLHGTASSRSALPEMRDLEATKRVTQSKLTGHREQIRINEAAIQHRSILIARLQQRLETIGDALQGDDDGAHERVDAVVLESLRKETEILSRDRIDNDARIAALDSDLDQLANRKRILENAVRVVEEEEVRRRKEHDRYSLLVEQQREYQRQTAERTMNSLVDEVASLRSESNSQRRSRSNPTNGEDRGGSPEICSQRSAEPQAVGEHVGNDAGNLDATNGEGLSPVVNTTV